MLRSEVDFSRYEGKSAFTVLETSFTALTILFSALKFFALIGVIVVMIRAIMCLPALKPVLWLLSFFFNQFGSFLHRLKVQLPNYGQKSVFAGF